VIESYGRMGDYAKELFKRTISAGADNKNIDISYVKNYWLKRSGIAVQSVSPPARRIIVYIYIHYNSSGWGGVQ
jgi:hypothetical protein